MALADRYIGNDLFFAAPVMPLTKGIHNIDGRFIGDISRTTVVAVRKVTNPGFLSGFALWSLPLFHILCLSVGFLALGRTSFFLTLRDASCLRSFGVFTGPSMSSNIFLFLFLFLAACFRCRFCWARCVSEGHRGIRPIIRDDKRRE